MLNIGTPLLDSRGHVSFALALMVKLLNVKRAISWQGLLILVLCAFAFGIVRNVREAIVRTRERRTMGTMLNWSRRIEETVHFAAPDMAGHPKIRRIPIRPTPETPLQDEWGTPLAIHIFKDGYEIRSAGADRHFDTAVFEGEKKSRAQDLVFADGNFIQWPETVVSLPPDYDPTPKRPSKRIQAMTQCSKCHAREYANSGP